MSETDIDIDCLDKGIDFFSTTTRAKFEQLNMEPQFLWEASKFTLLDVTPLSLGVENWRLKTVLAWSLRGENHPDAGASSYNLSIKERKASEGRPGAPAFDPPMPKSVS
ncbi:hypothetical protein ACLB2K_062327 [Fragaria x ananassa]